MLWYTCSNEISPGPWTVTFPSLWLTTVPVQESNLGWKLRPWDPDLQQSHEFCHPQLYHQPMNFCYLVPNIYWAERKGREISQDRHSAQDSRHCFTSLCCVGDNVCVHRGNGWLPSDQSFRLSDVGCHQARWAIQSCRKSWLYVTKMESLSWEIKPQLLYISLTPRIQCWILVLAAVGSCCGN